MEDAIQIPIGPLRLECDLAVPSQAVGVVLFAHGSGSSRRSPRNRYVAASLQARRFATLLMDLLTEDEVAAARRPGAVTAVVSRGGRPDLAGLALPRVVAPTLLIVGSLDREVIRLNRQAMAQMRAEVRLELVPGATHLFEEKGALDTVAALAGNWFATWLHTGAGKSANAAN